MNATTIRYEVECQEDCNDGTMHEATYSHDDQYSGKKVYVAVCNGYEDTYTEDVVRAVEVPEETPESLGLDLRPVDVPEKPDTEVVIIETADGSSYSREFEGIPDIRGFALEVMGPSFDALDRKYRGRQKNGLRAWYLTDHRGVVRAVIYRK